MVLTLRTVALSGAESVNSLKANLRQIHFDAEFCCIHIFSSLNRKIVELFCCGEFFQHVDNIL